MTSSDITSVPLITPMCGFDLRISQTKIAPLCVARKLATDRDLMGEDDPFFVMNMDQVLSQHEEWLRYLPRVQPHYAVKCNSDPVLLRLLAALGCGFDCASKNEIEAVLAMETVSPDRIIYANPCKTRNYIRHAAACGVRKMTFDNEDELQKIEGLFPGSELILRIAVSDLTAVCQLNVKFGCDPEKVAPRLLQIAADLHLNVVGISFHVGSGCRDSTTFMRAIAHAKRLFEIGQELGHHMSILDIGGGYPGYASREITFVQIADVVNEALETYFPVQSGVSVIAEPGRFYAASAFTLCCNVIAKKRVSGSKISESVDNAAEEGYMYYINDGVYGSFNCILYDHFNPTGEPLFRKSEEDKEALSAVWGPTCDGLDLVIPKCRLPLLVEGDWMVFQNMGAYTLAAGSEFNGFPRPAIFYCGGDDSKKLMESYRVGKEVRALSLESEDDMSSQTSSGVDQFSSEDTDAE